MLVANRVKEGGEGEKKKSLNEVLRVLVMRHDYTVKRKRVYAQLAVKEPRGVPRFEDINSRRSVKNN